VFLLLFVVCWVNGVVLNSGVKYGRLDKRVQVFSIIFGVELNIAILSALV